MSTAKARLSHAIREDFKCRIRWPHPANYGIAERLEILVMGICLVLTIVGICLRESTIKSIDKGANILSCFNSIFEICEQRRPKPCSSLTDVISVFMSFSRVAILGLRNVGIAASPGSHNSQTMEGVATFRLRFIQAVLKIFCGKENQLAGISGY